MSASSFSHLLIHVRQLERTRRFYEGLLGLEILAEEPGYLRLGGGGGFAIDVDERAASEVGAPGIELVLRVPDVDAAAERLREAGLGVTAPADQPSGGRHAWLHDPDGYRLSIYS